MTTDQPRARGWLRWCRGALVAAVAAGGGTVAHHAGGGHRPPVPVLLMLGLPLLLVATAALGRPATLRTLVLLVAGGQLLVHAVLTASTPHHLAPGGHLGGSGLARLGEHASGPQLLMTLAHSAAAVLVAAWLYVGERALWSLLVLLGAGLVRVRLSASVRLTLLVLRDLLRPEAAARVVVPVVERCRAARFDLSGPTGRRGPPAVSATFA